MSSSIQLPTPFSETVCTTTDITGFTVTSAVVVLFTSVTLFVVLDISGGGQIPRMVPLTGAAYTSWGADDTYLTTYVSTNLADIYHSST